VLRSTGVDATEVAVLPLDAVATELVDPVGLIVNPEVAEPLLVATACNADASSSTLSNPEPKRALEIDSISLSTDSMSVITPGLTRLYTSATASASFTPVTKVGVARVGILAIKHASMKLDKK
jgi:hypothetical protein